MFKIAYLNVVNLFVADGSDYENADFIGIFKVFAYWFAFEQIIIALNIIQL